MTRINAGIPPRQLSDKHLLAEHREIKRIPNCIAKGKARIDSPIPGEFTLGKGHVKFFYNKIKFLHNRYNAILRECRARRFDVTDFSEAFEKFRDSELYNDWVPTRQAIDLIRQRIKERNG